MDLAKRTELYIREQGLLQAGDRVLLAVSGAVIMMRRRKR